MNTGGLKVLMISSDRNIAVPGSVVAQRMVEYGSLVEEMHIVLLCDSSHGLKEGKLGSNVFYYPTNSSLKFFRPLDAARIGKKLVLEKKFVRGRSVITTQDPFECGWAGMKVKRRWRLPLEVQLHTDPNSPYFTGFLNNLRKKISKKVLAHANSIRVVSASLKSSLSTIYNLQSTSVSVLPIYVNKERIESWHISFDLHARFGWSFTLLSVARLAPEKNLNMALDVLAKVRETYPDTGLVIVGSGPEEKALKSKVKSLKLDGFVEFVGWQEDLGSYYKTSNLYLQTSLYEGYGLSLVEAGLSGLPVVTTAVGLAQELTSGQEAYIYPLDPAQGSSGQVAAMAEGVVDLLEHNQKREALRFNMRRTLEQKLLSKEEYLKQMQKNWEEVSQKIQ